MEIRKANKNDIQSIQNIAFETWPSAYGDILKVEQIDYMLNLMYNKEVLQKQMEESQTFIIIKEENEDLAFVSFETNYDKQAQTKIHKIYITPAAQGKGLGKILIEEAESQAIKKRNNKLLLNVNRQNKARYFYEKLGFKIAYSEDIEIGNGYLMNDYVMVKEIER
ncbi:GNAT family N-acetyltransferase [Lacihabitans sp. CS3-21]|uniref:GNAT family N-acetyltransferase n=1 Tax=Lacihabitans sp. CS3-21 TaxID=2487332 RepID=UPI0020CD7D8B|nr:GNAT family N-acetyltransferase [Lacihabitans sp. CS3-21]MCP9746891.1 GNAT family N-acetyltransferase [Lacihabitans sp. CS3-21]